MNDARLLPDRNEDEDAHLAVGCFAALCRDRLADRLLRFSRAVPRATIGVQALALAELLPAVRDGRLALAVAPAGTPGAQDGEWFGSMTLWREQVVVAMATGHPLATSRAVDPGALLEHLVLLSTDRAEGEMQRYQLARLFDRRRPALDARGGVLGRVAAGEGVALMLAGHATPAGVVTRPVAGAAAEFPVEAWWRTDDTSPGLATLLRLLAT